MQDERDERNIVQALERHSTISLKSFFPRGHQGKRRPIRPAFLAKGRSGATEFETLMPERLGTSLGRQHC